MLRKRGLGLPDSHLKSGRVSHARADKLRFGLPSSFEGPAQS